MMEISMYSAANVHYGAGLSAVEILVVLYQRIMRYRVQDPLWEERDRFILSKGHGVLSWYAVLEQVGFIDGEQLCTFQQDFGDFSSHPVRKQEYGIETSNGSLGHGLALAAGSLLAARIKQQKYRVYVLLGNGECNEGSVWEAAMLASQQGLDRLIAIVDCNDLQSDGFSSDIMDMSNMAERWKAFGWEVMEVDGHDMKALEDGLKQLGGRGRPSVLIAHTVKGKGISFMENNNEWHHNHLNQADYLKALEELEQMDD